MTPQRKLGSYHPGTKPGVSLCDTCTEDCKCDGEKVKCPDYVQHYKTIPESKEDLTECERERSLEGCQFGTNWNKFEDELIQ